MSSRFLFNQYINEVPIIYGTRRSALESREHDLGLCFHWSCRHCVTWDVPTDIGRLYVSETDRFSQTCREYLFESSIVLTLVKLVFMYKLADCEISHINSSCKVQSINSLINRLHIVHLSCQDRLGSYVWSEVQSSRNARCRCLYLRMPDAWFGRDADLLVNHYFQFWQIFVF